MKLSHFPLLAVLINQLFGFAMPTPASAESLYDLTVRSLEGEEVKLSELRGKVSLVVNTASKCGFTPQYEGLEALYKRFSPLGFTVLGFPSNDFMAQEPGDSKQIREFCQRNYGVSFPVFEKGSVKGAEKQPVYQFLTASGEFEGDPGWNFVKFLVDKNGKVRARYASMKKPEDPEVIAKIEELLKE